MPTVLLDTNILVGALLRQAGATRRVLRACLAGHYQPIVGTTLFLEYEAVLGRAPLFKDCPLSLDERMEIFDGYLSVCRWVEVYYAWRPNLPDEGDNHLIELAVAGGVDVIVTRNLRDLKRGELRFPEIKILSPEACLERYPCQL